MTGPAITFSIVRTAGGRIGDEERAEDVGVEQRDEAGEHEAEPDLAVEHPPVAAEVVRHVRPRRDRGDALAPGAAARRRGGARGRCRPRARARARALELRRHEQPQPGGHQHDHHDAAHVLRRARTATRSAPTGRGRAPTPGWSRRTGTPAPKRPTRPSGTPTCRSPPRRRSTTRRRRPGRSPTRRGAAPRRSAAARWPRAEPRPARSPRSGSRGRAPTTPPTPSGRRSRARPRWCLRLRPYARIIPARGI